MIYFYIINFLLEEQEQKQDDFSFIFSILLD